MLTDGLSRSVVGVTFQNASLLKMHQNNKFLFLKIYL
jgi:hypothetical protein